MRVFLGGRAVPRDEFALIGVGESTGVPLALLLEDGDVFTAEDYISLGYTNFEVFCIGAAGGRGGTFYSMRTDPTYSGGAGGGGGLHRVTGLLVDLPDTVAVDVGQPGSNGRDAGSGWPKNAVLDGSGYPATPLSLFDNPSYISALPGNDGGASSFGDVCKASGGKGGGVARQGPWVRMPYGPDDYLTWQVSVNGRAIPGDGGEGGLGNRVLAGGGSAGGVSSWSGLAPDNSGGSRSFTKPGDGGWDGAIGAGGGGGVGEILSWRRGSDSFTLIGYIDSAYGASMGRAAIGGKGSFSYADTAVYGPGQSYFYIAELPVPGSGGGAKIDKLKRYGAFTTGYNPAGAVFVRLTKID